MRNYVYFEKIYILILYFEKKRPKVKNLLFFHFMTNAYNFALKIETNWAKSVVEPNSKSRNANDVVVFLVYSFFEKEECEKE